MEHSTIILYTPTPADTGQTQINLDPQIEALSVTMVLT